MKRCPKCRRDYYDETLLYCLDDGVALVEGPASMEEPATAILTGDERTLVLDESLSGQSDQPSRSFTGSKLPPIVVGLLGIAVIVALGIGSYFYYGQPGTQINSIAVLPFVNESGNAEVEYLSDGMTETLISSLSQLPNLSVKARSSVFRYKGKNSTPKAIGSELNVEALVNGRLVLRGNDLILHVELVDTRTENVLWKSDYTRTMSNLVSLQNEIARDVSARLRAKLSGSEQTQIAKNYTQNAEAYRLYLLGRFHWSKFTEDGLRTAIKYFQQAIELDNNYALAHTGLSESYNVLGVNGYMPVKEAMPKVKSAAEKAVMLDDQLSQAHVSMGAYKYFYEWDLKSAESEFKRAMELDPGYPVSYQLHGYLLRSRGDFEAAIMELKKAQELDPLSLRINDDIGETLRYAGRTVEAIEASKKTLELDPNFADAHYTLAMAYSRHGMHGEAVTAINQALVLSENSTHIKAALGQIYAFAGKKAEAYRVIDELLSQGRNVAPLDIAAIYARLGENDKAFAWIEKAYEERAGWMIQMNVDPAWEKIRSDRRFQNLLRRIGLPG